MLNTKNMEYTVYLRTNKVNGKQYVGQTCDFKQREKDFKCLKARYGSHYFTEERNKYGLDNWKSEVLAKVATQEEAWELEKQFIKQLNTKYPNGYNMSDGGKDSNGYKHSEEQRQKWSDNRKGKHTSPSTEFKKGMTSWMKGKKMSDEHRKKDRLSHLGKISPKRKPVVQLSIDGEYIKEYTHAVSAAEELGFKSGESIRKACKESWRTSGGFKWMYKEDYEKMLAESPC